MRCLPAIAVLALVSPGCGTDPLLFEPGDPEALLRSKGEQIHPVLADGWLAWFDLEDDPNGACHRSENPGGWDSTCLGVVRVMDLASGDTRTVSDVIDLDTSPVLSDGIVAWWCYRQYSYGLCHVSVQGGRVEFMAPATGAWYNPSLRPVLDRGTVALTGYASNGQYAISLQDLRGGLQGAPIEVAQIPNELLLLGDRLVWIDTVWTEAGYRSRLLQRNLETAEQTVLVDDGQGLSGLTGSRERIAWLQRAAGVDADAAFHVFYQDPESGIQRADSDLARVSGKTPAATAGDWLVWIDHRDGDYRVAGLELGPQQEAILSPARAAVSGTMGLSTDGSCVVWTDARAGDLDLALWRFKN